MKTAKTTFTLPPGIQSITRKEILAMPYNGLDVKSLEKLTTAPEWKYAFANLIPGNGVVLFWGTAGEAKLAQFSDKTGIRRVILD